MSTEWTVHPNRSELGPNRPGRNGHYRPLRGEPTGLPEETCQARVTLPRELSHIVDENGTAIFAGPDWGFVVGAARSFARQHISGEVLPPFGFKDGRLWSWWDGAQTSDSILEAPDAGEHVRRYLQRLFPCATIDVSTRR
jgi:hypothetical protein